jgi:hypothetical protein
MRTLLRNSLLLVGAGIGVLANDLIACKGEVGLDVTLPPGVGEKALWVEIGAFKDGHCDGLLPMLGNGIPDGSTARLAFKKDDGAPKFGGLPNGKYAMAAVARDKDCTVLAVGCADEDMGSAGHVTIPLQAVGGDAKGKCPVGTSCQAAKCIPANDNADPSVGAGCSLELLGAGPLAKPAGGEGTNVSAPAIAKTSSGFVIAYREVDPSGNGARITILPIDTAGGAITPQRPPLPNPCSNDGQWDGVGLIVNADDSALMALGKPSCGAKPELQLLNFTAAPDKNGNVAVGKFFVSTSPNGDAVTLGAARSAAQVNGQDIVAFASGGTGKLAKMAAGNGIVQLAQGVSPTFGAPTGVTNAWIAASNTVVALLAETNGSTGTPTDPDAAAPPTGNDPATPDSTGGGTLSLQIMPVDADLTALNATNIAPPPITFPGQWGSIAASQGRVIVMSDGSGPGRSVSYQAFDLNNDTAADGNTGFSLSTGISGDGGAESAGTGAALAGDVVILGDRAYFAALQFQSVELHVYQNATTRLTPLRDVAFSLESRISAISTVRDGQVAIAATSSRVAVVWTTARKLLKNDATGGYAVFACTQ